MLNPPSAPSIIDERSWNTHSLKEVEEKGMGAGGLQLYFAGKTRAERGASRLVRLRFGGRAVG